ncbi:unnamed protein product [Calypogeia fissa]
MQWIKDKVGGNSNAAPEKQNFMIGSDRWTGSSPMAPKGSFRNPDSADNAVQAYDAAGNQPNPYVQYAQGPAAPAAAPSLTKNGGSSSSKKFGEEKTSSGMYPKIFESSEQRSQSQANAAAETKNGGSDEEEVEVLTGKQILVTIPGAIVHLIDEDESAHLATGDFSLVRLFQDKTKVVVIAKVGDQLQWPLVQEEPTVKLDSMHYFFTLTVPADMEDNDSSSRSKRDAGKVPETLNYGVTFPAGSATDDDHVARIRELDYFLERYSNFSAPTIVQGEANKDARKEAETLEKVSPRDPNFPGTVVPEATVSGEGTIAPTEENSKAFWTTIAPNVDDYNHKMAKGIAIGAGHIIRGIFWLSDSSVQKLDSGNIYMKSRFKSKEKKSQISSVTMGGVRTARRLTQMTDKVSAGVLGGLVYTTGLFSSAVVNSPGGKVFFKLLPGEVALVSLDSFGRVFDAVEKAGRDVMTRSSSVTQDFVNYRYGESAQELTDESLRTVGHVAATAWTVTKIRKALNPTKAKLSKTAIVKNLAKSAAGMNKKA